MELPLTKSGNRYTIVFQDFLSKWPFVFAGPDQKATRPSPDQRDCSSLQRARCISLQSWHQPPFTHHEGCLRVAEDHQAEHKPHTTHNAMGWSRE